MNKPLQIIAGLVGVAALALTCFELVKLMDIGTCASGGPYVSARQCPEGTGSRMLILTGAIFAFTIALIASGQGMFFFGLLFCALAAVFIRGGLTDDGFAAVGFGVGGLFVIMGLVPIVMAIRGWFDGDAAQGKSRAAGIAAFTQMAQQGVVVPTFATPAPAAAQPNTVSQLEELASLRDRGVLTDGEFQAQKARLLARG
jgi:Short C-terminal domain